MQSSPIEIDMADWMSQPLSRALSPMVTAAPGLRVVIRLSSARAQALAPDPIRIVPGPRSRR